MRRGLARPAALFLFLVCSESALAQDTEPKADVATLLFDQSMWRNAPAGSALRYGFARRTGRRTLGASFDDDIVVTLGPGADAESRTCEVKMFSGRYAKAAGPFFSNKINPVLVLVLELNVQELGRLTGIEPGLLKHAILKAWRDDARIADMSIDVGGRRVAGTRISVTPFIGDAVQQRMKGLDALTYAVEIADGVPGRIVRVDIRTPAGSATIFSETLRYAGSKLR